MSNENKCKPPYNPCERPCGGKQKTAGEGRPKSSNSCKVTEIWHPGFDARFPHMNKTRRCWQNYVDYYRCVEKFGEDHAPCEYFKKTFEYICPNEWISRWDGYREQDAFPVYPYKKCDNVC